MFCLRFMFVDYRYCTLEDLEDHILATLALDVELFLFDVFPGTHQVPRDIFFQRLFFRVVGRWRPRIFLHYV